MTVAQELIRNAKEIRTRLMRPQNAVKDKPIDLRKTNLRSPPIAVIEYPRIRARVFVSEGEPLIRLPLDTVPPPVKVDTKVILQAVSTHFSLKVGDLRGHCRRATISRPRQIAAYLLDKYTKRSSMSIGRELKKDHSSILHAKRKIIELMAIDPVLRQHVEIIEGWLLAGHQDSSDITVPDIGQQNLEEQGQECL